MGRGDRERACRLVAEFAPDLLQVLGFLQQMLHDLDHRLAWLGQGDDALAMAHENLHAELVLELADLLGDPGLGSVELLGRLGEIQALPYGLADVTQLLKIHRLM